MSVIAIILISLICLLSLIVVITKGNKIEKKQEEINLLEKDLIFKEKINTLQSIDHLSTDSKRETRRKKRVNRKMQRIKKLNKF
jgi:hypothetical protein